MSVIAIYNHFRTRKAEKYIVEQFTAHNALSPDNAVPLETLGIPDDMNLYVRAHLEFMVMSVQVEQVENCYWFDEPEFKRQKRNVRILFTALMVACAVGIGYFTVINLM